MGKRGRKKTDLVSEEFKNVIAGASNDELKHKVVNLSKYERETLEAKATDVKLVEATAEVKEFSAPYRDTLKTLRAERTYVLQIMQERGK